MDLNSDGYVDRVYIGDVGGQIWKFDVSAGATSSWAGKRLFAAPPTPTSAPPAGEYYPPQAIYGTLALALHNAGSNRFDAFLDLPREGFEQLWREHTLGGLGSPQRQCDVRLLVEPPT